MKHRIPDSLKEHILPFNWEVEKVWALQTDSIKTRRSLFDYLLDLPIWSSRRNAGMLFDIIPNQLLLNPESCPYQFERIAKANTDYPLDFINYLGKNWVLDGVHRLAKLKQNNIDQLTIRIHSELVIPLIAR